MAMSVAPADEKFIRKTQVNLSWVSHQKRFESFEKKVSRKMRFKNETEEDHRGQIHLK